MKRGEGDQEEAIIRFYDMTMVSEQKHHPWDDYEKMEFFFLEFIALNLFLSSILF